MEYSVYQRFKGDHLRDKYIVQINGSKLLLEDELRSSYALYDGSIVLTLLIGYLSFANFAPRFLESLPVLKLKPLLIFYDLCQVIFCTFAVYIFLLDSDGPSYFYNHMCHPLPRNENPLRIYFYPSAMKYLYVKIFDLLDTVFIVLAKRPLTHLHVFHHSTMVFSVWFSIRFIENMEPGFLMAYINMAVHIFMYTYYLLCGLSEHTRNWAMLFKRTITKMQIAQFVILLGMFGALWIWNCEVNIGYFILWVFNVSFLLVLFIHFYYSVYLLEEKQMKFP